MTPKVTGNSPILLPVFYRTCHLRHGLTKKIQTKKWG